MDLIKAKEQVQALIQSGQKHRDYDHVVKLAEKYKQLITGDGIDKILRQFVQREDEVLFKQRCDLTKSITPSVANTIKTPFQKITRNDKIVKSIGVKDETKKQNIQTMIASFYGNKRKKNKGLEGFLNTRFLDYTFTDPNSWVVVEWEAVDKSKIPSPRPFVVHADEAVNFSITNDETQWLLVCNAIKYKRLKGSKEVLEDGKKYTMYENEITIVYEQCNKEWVEKNYTLQANEELYLTEQEKECYIVRWYEPKIGFVPAFRVGYFRDLSTNGRTFVNPFHPAMPYFEKMVERVSELDLTMKLHTFPQKFQYVQKCKGESKTRICKDGIVANGEQCKACKGTGVKIHTTSQDAVLLRMPESKEEMLDLDKLMVYKAPPIEIVKIQIEYKNELKADAIQAVFNSDVFVQSSIVKTATEKSYDMESVYDTLSMFAEKYSDLWIDVVSVFCRIVEIELDDKDFELVHSFPSDLKLKTISMLLAEMQACNDSQAPSFMRDAINKDIADIVYNDDKLAKERYEIKRRFFPFNGKSFDEIALATASEFVPRFDKVLYFNFEKIFAEIEKDDAGFYVRKFPEQWKIIGEKVNKIIEDIDQTNADRFQMNDLTGANATKGQNDKGGAQAGGNAGNGNQSQEGQKPNEGVPTK